MIQLLGPMYSRRTGPNLRYASCWAILRSDGGFVRVTGHNSNLVVNNFVYHASAGFDSSARERQANFQDRNMEVKGYLSSDYITEDDLRAGKYRNAEIIEYIVDWMVPWAGIFSTSIYYIQEVNFTNELWNVQVVGLTQRLKKERGDIYSRLCQWDLFSEHGTTKAGCKLDKTPFIVSGSVTTVTTQRNAFQSTLTSVEGYLNRGIITWTSGANLGDEVDVQSYKNASGKVVLFQPTGHDIAPGDTFTAEPGCDKLLLSDCQNKFNNVINFGGDAYLPGTDEMVKVPMPLVAL